MPGIVPVAYGKMVGDNKTRKVIDEAADQERKARIAMIERNWRYYYGDHDQPFRTRVGEPDQNVIENVSGIAIDKLATFVGIPMFEVTMTGADGEPLPGIDRQRGADGQWQVVRSPEQQTLDAIWEANELKMFMGDLLISSMVCGHAFVRVDVDDDDADSWPSAEVIDPRYIQVFWDMSKSSRRLFYRLTWQMGDMVRRQDIVPDWLYGAEGDERPVYRAPDNWHIVEYEEKAGGKWEPVGEDIWNQPFAPVVDWKNSRAPHEYYGRSDMRTALNDKINFVASDIKKILYHHAGPQIVITGGALEEEQELGPGTIIEDLPAEARMTQIEMQGDLHASMAYLQELKATFFGERRVVDPAVTKDKLGQLTNFGLRVLYTDQIDIADERRGLHGKGVAEVSRRLLALVGTAASVRPVWDEALPADRTEQVQTLAVEVDTLKVTSRQTASRELGRDFEVEQAQREEEQLNETDALAGQMEALGNRGFVSGM